MKHEVIVVGAGVGGLSAAIRLAANGWRVTVLERLERVGGTCDCAYELDDRAALVGICEVRSSRVQIEDLAVHAAVLEYDRVVAELRDRVCGLWLPHGDRVDAPRVQARDRCFETLAEPHPKLLCPSQHFSSTLSQLDGDRDYITARKSFPRSRPSRLWTAVPGGRYLS
ncbi:MAG: FAD-dependent oxidoreductase [Sphingomonadales bacterium]|nr:FAD-dependent oxidoreductase [Sphingomonadales bacterium]